LLLAAPKRLHSSWLQRFFAKFVFYFDKIARFLARLLRIYLCLDELPKEFAIYEKRVYGGRQGGVEQTILRKEAKVRLDHLFFSSSRKRQ
jgi:hypothetical protein